MLRSSEKLEIIKKLKNLGYNGYYGDIISKIETTKPEPEKYDLGGTLNTSPTPLSAGIPTIKKGKTIKDVKNKTYADMGWFTDSTAWSEKAIDKYSTRPYLQGDIFMPSWGKKGKIKVSTEGGIGAGVRSKVPENFDVTKPPKTLKDAFHMALAAGAETDAEARVMAAQWAVESGHGKSKSARNHHAYFGIKGSDFVMGTHEVRDGKHTTEDAGWAGFSSPLEGFKARVAFTKKAKGRYRTKGYGKDKSDLELANILSEAGYATSPTYAANLKRQLKKLDYNNKSKKVTVSKDTMQRTPRRMTSAPMSLEDFEKTTIKNYRDELHKEREKAAYGGLIKTKAPQRYVGKAYQDRENHTGFMEGDLNMYMANGGELDLSPKGGPKTRPKIEEISNDYNADGIMKARIAYDVMHGNPGAKRLVRKGVGTRENYLEIEKDVKKFADKYVTSDHHRKLLEKYNYPEDKIHWRMQDILNYNPDRDTRFALSGNSYVGGAGEHFPIKEGQQKGQPIVQYNLFNPHPSPIDQVVSHEWGHIPVSSGFNPLSEEERNEFISRLKPGAVKNEHDAEPQENRSDQFELRYFLDKAGIYDSSTGEEFTQKHLDDYREKTGTHHRMFNLYGDEDIIWLMNNIAAVNNGEELNMAKYGGPLSGSNSGGPKKKKGTVGQKSTDSFMSNAYFNEEGDGIPFKSNMGEIVDLNLPQTNDPRIRFVPHISGSEKGMHISGNINAQLNDNLSLQGGVGRYYDFSPEAEESKAKYNLGLKYRFPNKRK